MLRFSHTESDIKNLKTDLLITQAAKLPTTGTLAASDTGLVYLDISDDYIHQLFPLLENKNNLILKPDYFNKYLIGAHITVIYTEENKLISSDHLGEKHNFQIKDLIQMHINSKIYYALSVESPSLLELRRKHGLPDKLNFKGHKVGLHITIGTLSYPPQQNNSKQCKN